MTEPETRTVTARPTPGIPASLAVEPDGTISYAGWIISGAAHGDDAVIMAIAEWFKAQVAKQVS